MVMIMIRVEAKPAFALSFKALLRGMITKARTVTPAPVADLPPALLADIGVARRDYRGATGRMYWDAPDHWFNDPARR